MVFDIILLVSLVVYALQSRYHIKKLEMKSTELQWRIESLESSTATR